MNIFSYRTPPVAASVNKIFLVSIMLKTADVTLKSLLSIFPVLLKLYEKSMFKQMSEFFENIFLKKQCEFRRDHSTQQCLLQMLKKWKRSVDSGKAFGALLTDLSKALHCLDHELLTSKLNTYGFSLPALRLVYDYLSQRRRRTRVSNPYSEWLAVMFEVP